MGGEVSAGANRGGRPTGDSDDYETGLELESLRLLDQEEVVSALKHSLQTGANAAKAQRWSTLLLGMLRRAAEPHVGPQLGST